MVRQLNGADALLMIGASDRDADLYYATRFRAPDPFVFLWTTGEKILLANSLEIDRARDQARVDRVLAYAEYEERAKERGADLPAAKEVLLELLRDLALQKLQVPADFPLGTADFLRSAGVALEVAGEPLFPERQIKDEDEIASVRRAMQATEAGMETAIGGIRAAQVRDGALFLEGEPLTSERLRRMVHQTLMDCDSIGEHTIIAGGDQGCDPHQEGFGPLRAHETIIIDIFPRDERSGYYGDLTRTICKGARRRRRAGSTRPCWRHSNWAWTRSGPAPRGTRSTSRFSNSSSRLATRRAKGTALCRATSTAPGTVWGWRSTRGRVSVGARTNWSQAIS